MQGPLTFVGEDVREVDEFDCDGALEGGDASVVAAVEEPLDGGAVVHEEDGARVRQVLSLPPAGGHRGKTSPSMYV